ncbi:MAG: UDP-N-acetylmuramoyl-tripeptide--D-alanyl-D-alanine ligase [Gemmatimonadales bacterium]
MSRWNAEFVARALGVPVSGVGFREISTDTRTLAPGALFVALTGEQFDGHAHLAAARDKGALAAVVRRGTPVTPGLTHIEVGDTLAAYGRLGRERRREFPGPVIAITGSNGKTSTKEMLAAVLRTRWRVHATKLNLNNLVGIPQTILAAPPGTEALVVEAGASEAGELARARDIIEPTLVVITNVQPSHLDGFRSVEGVMFEKLTLAREVKLAVVGTDPPRLAEGARRVAERVISAGLEGADRVPDRVSMNTAGEPTFEIDGHRVHLPIRGRHQVGNAMLAWAVGRELFCDPAAMASALGSLVLPGGRGELIQHGGLTVLNDAYNANPASFLAVMDVARAMRGGRRLVFVAGTMRELGADSARYHREVADALVALAPELLAAVGEFVPALEPHRAVLGDRLLTAPDAVALGPLLAARLQGDELVVLKASRGPALERILPSLGITATAPSH